MSFLFKRKKVGPEYYFERGKECFERGDYRWALESFSKAIELNPGLEMAYYKRGEVYKKLGKIREAMRDYVMFLEVDRRGYEGAGNVKELVSASWKNYQLISQRDKAKDEIRAYGISKIIEELMEEYDPRREYNSNELYKLILSDLKKTSPKQWNYVGFIQLLRNDFDRALDEFNKAIEETPNNPYNFYFRGVVLLKKMEKVREKDLVIRKSERVKELWDKAYSSFIEALKLGLNSSLCQECGYKTKNPELSFCIYCGKKLRSNLSTYL